MRSTVPREAVAFWVRSPGVGELRRGPVREPAEGEVLVRTLFSGVSRGTETLVFRGEVPGDQYAAMRAPFQEGDFPGPVKYGYLNVGRVERGPAHLVDRTVFCLHPHQSRYVVPADAVVPVPASVPPERAVLGGMVETAVNALWDAPPLLGDRVTVVGAGVLGCCVARLLTRVPGVQVCLVDVDAARAALGQALGVTVCPPDAAPTEQDLVLHTSATSAGLRTSLEIIAPDATVVDLSWYGDRDVTLALGGRFHSARLGIRASQVGAVAPARRERRSPRDRLALALELLDDPAFDVLLTSRGPLADLPGVMARLAAGDRTGIVHTVTYEEY